MNLLRNILFVLNIFCLSACAAFTPGELAVPSSLTIDEAMGSIGAGFKNMHSALEGNKTGLWPCKVTILFNVTASADQGGKLVLDTSVKAPANFVCVDSSGHGELTNNSSASRANTVTIEMYSAACLPRDVLGFEKPEAVKTVVDGLKEGYKQSHYNFLDQKLKRSSENQLHNQKKAN